MTVAPPADLAILPVDPAAPPSKQALMRAALTRFVRDGVAATSIRAIADDAGYTNPALYKFWDGRDQLVLAVFEACYRELVRHLGGAWTDGGPPLTAFVRRYLEALDRDLDAVLFVQEQLRPLWRRASPATRRRSLLALVRRLVPDAAPAPSLIVAAIVGTLGQFARQVYFGELEPPAAGWQAPLETLLGRILGDAA